MGAYSTGFRFVPAFKREEEVMMRKTKDGFWTDDKSEWSQWSKLEEILDVVALLVGFPLLLMWMAWPG